MEFMRTGESWQCPHCHHHATLSEDDISEDNVEQLQEAVDGYHKLYVQFIVCPNAKCKEITLRCELTDYHNYNKLRNAWDLIPDHSAKKFPNYVPRRIREGYIEACKIQTLSPQASAALARRCVEGIINDFWKVKGRTLFASIEAAKKKNLEKGPIDEDIWEAVDAVRKVGNIATHMKESSGLIVDIKPGEAEALIQLIETLIEETYVARAKRKARINKVTKIAAAKKAKPKEGDNGNS